MPNDHLKGEARRGTDREVAIIILKQGAAVNQPSIFGVLAIELP